MKTTAKEEIFKEFIKNCNCEKPATKYTLDGISYDQDTHPCMIIGNDVEIGNENLVLNFKNLSGEVLKDVLAWIDSINRDVLKICSDNNLKYLRPEKLLIIRLGYDALVADANLIDGISRMARSSRIVILIDMFRDCIPRNTLEQFKIVTSKNLTI